MCPLEILANLRKLKTYNYYEVSMVSAQFQTFENRRVNNVTETAEKRLIYTRGAQMVQIHLYVISDVHFIYSITLPSMQLLSCIDGKE